MLNVSLFRSSVTFFWLAMKPMIVLAICASVLSAFPVSANSTSDNGALIQESQRLKRLGHITRSMDRGISRDMEAKITQHLQRYPDDASAYGQYSRLIMRTGFVSDDTLIGFHFTKEADGRATQALLTALELAPDNMVELSRLGYLHAVQGRYKQAEEVFAEVRQGSTLPLWQNHNEAILAIGLEQYSKAVSLLEVNNRKRPAPNSELPVWSVYRNAWKLRKAIALKYPETDPVAAVREGKIRRISIDNVYDEAVQTSASGKPTIVVLSSSDDGCPFCATDLTGLGQVVDTLDEEYHFVYASMEPWNDIEKYTILRKAFDLNGLPNHFIVHEGRYFGTIKGAFSDKKLPDYKRIQREILDGTRDANRIANYETLLNQDIKRRMRVHMEKQTRFSAAAIAVEGRQWTSGSAGGSTTQADANAQAMLRCQRNVISKNMNASCQPFVNE